MRSSSCSTTGSGLWLDALDALADADARPPAEHLDRAIAVVVQARERGAQPVDGDRARPAERAERVLAELAEREHHRARHMEHRPGAAGEAEHVFLGQVLGVDDLDDLAA